MPVLAIAAIGLAIFTTIRTAGPLILITRASDAVKEGNLDHRLRFRQSDRHLKQLEVAFNDMMVSICGRADFGQPKDAEASASD